MPWEAQSAPGGASAHTRGTSVMGKLWHPPDIERAADEWEANCGPCSLAAILGARVRAVRRYFPHFPERPYTTITTMKAALDRAGVGYVPLGPHLPRYGLVFLGWG